MSSYYSPDFSRFTATDSYLNNSPYVASPSDKPPVPALMNNMVINMTGLEQMPYNQDIIGYEPTNNNLFLQTGFTLQTSKTIMNNTITPTWYFDLTQPSIGNRPVYAARNRELDVPDILMVKQTKNPGVADGDFSCYQPNWSQKCAF